MLVSEPEPGYDGKQPWYKTCMMWVCGIEKREEHVLTPEEQEAIKRKQTSLAEDPLYKKICNINAIVLMTVTVFFWGFFY
jgi:hypothetical protein